MKNRVSIAILLLLPIPLFAQSQERKQVEEMSVQISRYAHAVVAPTFQQKKMLQTVVDISIPQEIETIGDALPYVLKGSGYHLSSDDGGDISQYYIYGLNLPDVHRKLGPITLIDALKIIGGEGFELTVNPIKRTISFKISDDYSEYISDSELKEARQKWINRVGYSENTIDDINSLSSNKHQVVYGPVKSGETLSGIVKSLKLTGVSANKMMLGIFQRNPNAFIKKNINMLKEGENLIIDEADSMANISASEVSQRVQEHHRKWISIKNDK